MWRHRPVSVRARLACILLAGTAGFALAANADEVPASVAALFPAEAKPGNGNWAVMETEFGKTFGADMVASSFAGQSPSCVFAGTPELKIGLKGDTAWENPPMLDMAIAIHQEDIARAPAAMATYVSNYVKGGPDVVSVSELREERLPNGHIVYVEYRENCTSHPNGSKTRLRGFARRGATQLDLTLVVALDGTAAMKIAGEIFANFDRLDIAALTR